VRHINFVGFNNFKDMNSFKEFITHFTKLDSIEGITTPNFNPLQIFMDAGKRVPKVFWSPGEKEITELVLQFLQFN
jgi:hypothetical protein